MQQADSATHRGLTRRAIIDRALELGDAEGLEAVSLRRLATELGVTPMALYRHVKDKQDLVNAMYEAIVEDFDLKADVRPGMKWTNQLRRALMNFIALHDRPVALPLAIAYSGSGSPAIWRLYEDGLGILLGAGFTRREAVALNRRLSIVVAGYLMLFHQAQVPESELMVARKRFELELLSLPRADYPNVVASAPELVDAQFSNPQQLLKGTVDFIVGGVEAMLTRRRGSLPPRHT
jgi:TetR/AcrR family tetracycline transcriptional repressor